MSRDAGRARFWTEKQRVNWLKRRSPLTRVLHATLLALLLAYAAVKIPTPYLLTAPGPSYRADTLVHVNGAKTYTGRGQLLLLTVLAEPANLLYCCYALFDSAASLERLGAAPKADSDDGQMFLSQSLAMEVAFDHLVSLAPSQRSRALQFAQIHPNSPNASRLQVDDVLETIAGRTIRDVGQVGAFLRSARAGARVKVEVLRQGRRQQLELSIWNNAGRNVFGVVFRPVMLDQSRVVSADIQSDRVSGASGGLVFALEIIHSVSPQDITHGKTVAVTGTLDRSGWVGSVEGIRMKYVSAQRARADLFLCPKENLGDLKEFSSSTPPIVGVESLSEALKILQGL